MEFFERAHVTRKETPRTENKPKKIVKKQIKELLHAYKKGNNQEIKNVGEKELSYDNDDVKSLSEYSEVSFLKHTNNTEKNSTRGSAGSHSDVERDNSSHSQCTSKSDTFNEDSLASISEDYMESPSLSRDTSTIEKDLSSTFDSSSIISEEYSDSDISIPSSLRTSRSTLSEYSDDNDFDPDGVLASKILDKLNSKKISPKKRKLSNELDLEDKINDEILKEACEIQAKKEKKNKKKTVKEKGAKTVDLGLLSKQIKTKNMNEERKFEDSLDGKNFEDSSLNSSPYVSVLATDMESQSLDDIVGDYVHSTVKNLPSQKQHIVCTPLSKYTILDEMISGEIAEDISSVVPEIDEDLHDLTLESELPDDTEITDDMEISDVNSDLLSNKTGSISLYNGRNNYILILKHPGQLYVHGKVTLTALGGSVEVFGYTLQNETVDIFAPYCYYAHCIKSTGNSNEFSRLFSKLIDSGLTTLEAEEILSSIGENDAVIGLSSLNYPHIDFIDNNFNVTELFTKRNEPISDYLKKAADSLGCSLYLDEPKKKFDVKATWEEVVVCGLNINSRGIICGGKGLGKSTFLRYYINRLVSNGPVVVIDLDPGQAEFTVPGNISVTVVETPLIGPNFTHLKKPDRMLNIGMISTMDNPYRYISAVTELFAYCKDRQEYQNIPWIVNTMGMCNDIGLKFLVYILIQLQPTFLYQIDSNIRKKRFDFELQPQIVENLHVKYMNDSFFAQAHLPSQMEFKYIKSNEEETSQKGINSPMSPKDERYLNVLAYFSQLVEIHRGKSILEIIPYEVNIQDLNIGVNVNIPQQYLTKVINGKIIALCQLPTVDKARVFKLNNEALLCHGYGLVRSIDFSKGLLYILTPVPLEGLKLVNALVYTDWMPELYGIDKELPSHTIIPYRLSTVENPIVMSRPRRRFNPLQLIKATRNA